MDYSFCIDLLYLEITPQGPIFANTEKIIEGMYLAKDTGFQAVEFWDWENKDMELIIAKKEELGLKMSSICTKDRGTLADKGTHQMAMEGLRQTIPVAKRLGCDKIIVTAQNVPGIDREESYSNIVEGLKKLVPLAEKDEITLILEPIYGSFFVNSAEAFAMLNEVSSPNLKLLYDFYHFQLMEGNLIQTIKKNLDKIGHIHIASAPDRTEITDGELNYTYLLREIKNSGYNNYIALEYRPTTDKAESLISSRKLFV
ncbi:MAG TPA: TIM barrel protein [Clostridiales bacterium]|nr:TIM barrel protein [Clostridiales bacterium]